MPTRQLQHHLQHNHIVHFGSTNTCTPHQLRMHAPSATHAPLISNSRTPHQNHTHASALQGQTVLIIMIQIWGCIKSLYIHIHLCFCVCLCEHCITIFLSSLCVILLYLVDYLLRFGSLQALLHFYKPNNIGKLNIHLQCLCLTFICSDYLNLCF